MTVRLRFQSTGLVPGDGAPVIMHGPSLTIGRGEGNDIVLPDPDRMVSKTHCVIEDHNGNVVAVDLSSNGTFLNYGKIPMGKTPTPLNSGDILILGPYELVVEIARGVERIADPLAEDPASFGDADRAPDPLDLMDAAGPGGDFLDDLLGPSKTPTGPKQFNTDPADPFDELLAPLGADEDPFFGGAPDAPQGPAARDSSAAITDAFRPARAQAGIIPDDWDDLLAPAPAGQQRPAPRSGPAHPAGSAAADPFAADPFAAAAPPANALPGDFLSGDPPSGDLPSDDPLSGDLLSGDLLSGDLLSGDPHSDDQLSGGARRADPMSGARSVPAPSSSRPPKGDRITRKYSNDEPFSAFVFRTIADPFAGRINVMKIVSGKVTSDATVYNSTRGEQERFGGLNYIQGKNLEKISEAATGDIVAAVKLKDTQTGDTLCDKNKRLFTRTCATRKPPSPLPSNRNHAPTKTKSRPRCTRF